VSIDLVVTDPPFGINYQNNYTSNKHAKIEGDESFFSYEILARECFRVLKDDTAIFCFTGWSEYPHHFTEIESAGFKMKEPLICQKKPAGGDLYGSFQPNSDWVLFAHKGRFIFQGTNLMRNKRAGTIPAKGRKPTPEFKGRFPACWFGEGFPYSSENPVFQAKYNMYHPTIKSQKFIEWLIQLSTKEGDTVLDPFMGSWTTAVAAKHLKRNFIGCDKSKDYCEIGKRRIENLMPDLF